MKLYIYDIDLNLVTVIDDIERFESGILSDAYIQRGYIISASQFDIS
jgi:hypothetical protein